MSLAHRVGGWDGAILAAAAFIAPPLAVFAPLGMAPLVAILSILLLVGDMARSRGWPRGLIASWHASPNLRLFTLLGAILWSWMIASSAWSVDVRQSLVAVGQISGFLLSAHILLAVTMRLSETQRRVVEALLFAGLAIALAIYASERLTAASLGRFLRDSAAAENETLFSPFNRGLTVTLMLGFAALAFLLRAAPNQKTRGLVAMASLAILTIIVISYFGNSLQIAVMAALIAVALTILFPRVAPLAVGAIMALYVALAPLLPPQITPRVDIVALSAKTGNVSISHRLIIWEFSAERIVEKPFSGWGLNASRSIPGGKDTVILSMANGFPSSRGEQLPLHTHNAALQWWLELGMPGAVLMAGLWLFALSRIPMTATRGARASCVGAWIGGFMIANLSYGAWQSWLLATFTLAAALATLALREPGTESA